MIVLFQINPNDVRSPMVALISVTISTDQTIIWYDHWEDGFDQDVANKTAKSTEIWGDGIAANGCSPMIKNCTNSLDRLMAGASVVIQNTVPIPRVRTSVYYDGADRLQASLPIAVTRAGYASVPGSLLAGAGKCYDLFRVVIMVLLHNRD